MIIIRTVKDLREFLKRVAEQKTVGFVPTMGDLHEGHLSLIRRSKKENDLTAISIFVNPKQFDRREDYERYKRNEREDLHKARAEGVDLVFIPTEKQIYPEGFQTWIRVEVLSKTLCGPFRPGHFRGVATIVLKLFQLVRPTRAYFGMKDYQQLKIIERMAKDLNLPVMVVPCPTIREKDGLALSSRNSRLSPMERERAASIHLALKHMSDFIKSSRKARKKPLELLFNKLLELTKKDRLEYFNAVNPQTLEPLNVVHPPFLLACAVWIGGTRLIDNILIQKK